MKKILIIASWILVVAGLIVALAFTEKEHKKAVCKDFVVDINYGKQENDYFITAGEITQMVYKSIDTFPGKNLNSISTKLVEEKLSKNPYVLEADVFYGLDGVIHARIIQRKAIVKVMSETFSSYYISDDGIIMPINELHSAYVLIANGYIPDVKLLLQSPEFDVKKLDKNSAIFKIYSIARYISNDEFLSAQISQLFINEKSEIELIPRIGKHIILFGSLKNMEEKFENLKIFYKKGLPYAGWNKYKLINLKFKNQVVCSKTE